MKKYSPIKEKAQKLRAEGLTYDEINQHLGVQIPKSTLSGWCTDIPLSEEYHKKINARLGKRLEKIRELPIKRCKETFDEKLAVMLSNSQFTAELTKGPFVGKIALALLYLVEGAKWKGHRGLLLASTDPRILRIYINLLTTCCDVSDDSLHCRVQHRADQDGSKLVKYWPRITGVSANNFYPCYADKRTIGKPALKKTIWECAALLVRVHIYSLNLI